MTPLPLTLVLFTSTKGHFGRDTYQRTVNDWLHQLPAHNWAALHANVKWEPGQETKCDEMKVWLKARGFVVTTPCQAWRHQDPSHQQGYLDDMYLVTSTIKSSYYLHLEDDFLLCPQQRFDTDAWLAGAIRCLEHDTSLLQVRFARWANEVERIESLKVKHGIDAKVIRNTNGDFWHSDWSNNPFVARTRDVHAALRFLSVTNLPRHSEHGLATAMKLLTHNQTPFYSFDPSKVYCRHIGTLPGEEDPLDKPIYAT